MTTTTIKKSNSKLSHPARNSHSESLREGANRIGHEAREVAYEHLVRPTLQAAREASGLIEERARHTTTLLQEALHRWQKDAVKNPRKAAGYVFGAGLFLGMWLRRR